MDNKTKKIVFIVCATLVSLISTIVGVVLGVPKDSVMDAVEIDFGICETL